MKKSHVFDPKNIDVLEMEEKDLAESRRNFRNGRN